MQKPADTKKIEPLALYRTALRIRLVEERLAALYPEQDMRCPTHFSIGQEAVATGVAAALRERDLFFGTYRSHALYLARGGSLPKMVAEIYGRRTGACQGKSGSMQIIAPEVGLLCTSAIVGGTLPMAVGAAYAAVYRKTGQVACAVFGDAATEEGVFHESMNFAALKQLPVVFVCENNFYAVYTPFVKRQPRDNIYQRASSYGLPGTRVDGNDAVAVQKAVAAAAQRARQGKGPSLIECRTYRWLEHCGPHLDPTQPPEELAKWKKRDPIGRLEKRLLSKGSLNRVQIEALRGEIGQELDDAVAFAKKSPFPDPSEIEQDVYA